MNNKTIIEFGFPIIWRIMEISEGVIRLRLRPRRITPSWISIILHSSFVKYITNKICNSFLSFGLVIQHFLLAKFFYSYLCRKPSLSHVLMIYSTLYIWRWIIINRGLFDLYDVQRCGRIIARKKTDAGQVGCDRVTTRKHYSLYI